MDIPDAITPYIPSAVNFALNFINRRLDARQRHQEAQRLLAQQERAQAEKDEQRIRNIRIGAVGLIILLLLMGDRQA